MTEKNISKVINRVGNRYMTIGFIFGLVLSLVFIKLGLDRNELTFSPSGIVELHEVEPVAFLLDFFPFVLAFTIYFVTKRMSSFAGDVSNQLTHKIERSKVLSDFASELGKGNYDAAYEAEGSDDILGNILIEMRDNTKENLKEERRRSWSVSGIAKFGEILRNNLNDLDTLSDQVIRELVKYMDCNQGGVFLKSDNEEDPHIEMVACYAYERKKFLDRRLELEEGLVGQCMLEKDVIFLTDVPDNYVNITSGLGKANPTCILVVPLIMNEEVFGAIELASFKTLEPYQIEFVKAISTSFASTVSTVKMNQNTSNLLEESRLITEQLQEKEEEMMKNAQELESIQDELSSKLQEIEEETTKTKNIVEAINKTNASIEYDLEGNIIDVNDMFLSVTGYDREDLIGQHESFFVPEEEKNSPRYEIMWGSLSSGSFFSGEFRRVAANGKQLWLTGTYNPIYNIKGEPVKIIKYAQFTTDEKEKALDLNSKINALGSVLPVLEVKPDGSLISGNKLFIEKFKYKRLALKKLKFDDLIVDDNAKAKINDFTANLSGGTSLVTEIELVNSDGDKFYYIANISCVLNLSDEVVKLLVLLVDIDEQKKLKNKLIVDLEEERKKNAIISVTEDKSENVLDLLEEIVEDLSSGTSLDDLVSNHNASVVILDNEGTIKNLNQNVAKLFNVDYDSLLNHSVLGLIDYESDAQKDQIAQSLKQGNVHQDRIKFNLGEGKLFNLDVVFTPVFSDDELRIIMLIVSIE